jgi:hypothetical protein
MRKRMIRASVRWHVAALAVWSLLLAALPQPTLANTIFVTSLAQFGGPSDCTLVGAIYASKLKSAKYIALYFAPGQSDNPVDSGELKAQMQPTGCVAGSGNDTIILPTGATLVMNFTAADADDFMGRTATPMITGNIVIEANGATLLGTPGFVRAFAVGPNGSLTLRNAHIKGFGVTGGAGAEGGGGGLGAGGAIYVSHGGHLAIAGCTFDHNSAQGGAGGGTTLSSNGGGGGGGLSGTGSGASTTSGEFILAGGTLPIGAPIAGGGGGSSTSAVPGAGGGTYSPAGDTPGGLYLYGGFNCGGTLIRGTCPGGGGGGAFSDLVLVVAGSDGAYGGGGGGGDSSGGKGGSGGFGGGGGGTTVEFQGSLQTYNGVNGGAGGFGGGGGNSNGDTRQPNDPGAPGVGGEFAGAGNRYYGGGGAGLGGAIFSENATVRIENSTFTSNFTYGGAGGGPDASGGQPAGAAQSGEGAGGAVFALGGSLTISNSTISGNGSSEFGGGLAMDQTFLPASLELTNTILAGNIRTDGSSLVDDCRIFIPALDPTTPVSANGAGNLIQVNTGCPGVTVTGDPKLGPLQNNLGFTPTMAIGRSSAAFNTGDGTFSLPVDQRGVGRPSEGGFDIGAYEFCDPVRNPHCFVTSVAQAEPLNIIVSPPAGGTTTPGAGEIPEPQNTVVALAATPSPGFVFASWLGNVTSPTSATTTVVMNQPQTITANFIACDCAADVSNSVSVTRGGYVLNPGTKRYAQTVVLTNTSATAIQGPISLVVDGLSGDVSLFNLTGSTDALFPPAGDPYISSSAGLAPAQSVSVTLQFTDPTRAAITYNTRVLAGPGSR